MPAREIVKNYLEEDTMDLVEDISLSVSTGDVEMRKESSARRPHIRERSFTRYPPCSIVWTPIPGISWFIPIIGHMGITDEEGLVHEFMGMGVTQNPDGMSFGPVTRYVPFSKSSQTKWALGLNRGCQLSEGRIHKGFVDNCHTFVADSLNGMDIHRFRWWNSILLAFLVFFFGRYTSIKCFLYHVLPSVLFFGVLFLLSHHR